MTPGSSFVHFLHVISLRMFLCPFSESPAKLGQTPLRGHTFVWDQFQDSPYIATQRRKTQRVLHGVQAHVLEFDVTYSELGLRSLVELASDGRILSMSVGPQFRLKLEERETSQAGVSGLDVANAGVPLSRPIQRLSDLDELHIRVSLPGKESIASRGRRLSSQCKDSVCDIRIRRAAGNKVDSKSRQSALRADQSIDHDKPSIKALAERITAGKADAQQVRALVSHVNGSLRKQLATNLPSASAVLDAGFGDCTEHTWLFVALARAAGIPARPVYGLAYVEGTTPRFGYHAWAEIEWQGHWVEVDPTWGQERAGVGHIALGEDAHAMAAVFGSIRIDVLGSSPRQRKE